jgi:hypothetical protein
MLVILVSKSLRVRVSWLGTSRFFKMMKNYYLTEIVKKSSGFKMGEKEKYLSW